MEVTGISRSNRWFGVDVIINDVNSNPHCPHGPTLIFERYTTSGEKTGRRFFACSACRDRKDCPFFQWVDQPSRQERLVDGADYSKHCILRKKLLARLKAYKKLPLIQRRFCTTCSQLLLPDEWQQHADHPYVDKVGKKQLHCPSRLLTPLENSKKEAQYLFSEKATKFIVSILKELHFTRILCIGTPRIHEYISSQKNLGMTSLLLDIDARYSSFFGSHRFCQYNMFNHFFFGGPKEEAVFTEFVEGDPANKLAVVVDPPFGGLVEVIAHTLKIINSVWKTFHRLTENEVSVLWFFPYFNESRLLECLPSLTMLDYKVDYENHPLFHSGKKGRKQGSPVRIFTNIDPSLFKLPENEGYRFCALCQRYVSRENKHCEKCQGCTSKDGRPYRHCAECKRCVKSSYEHCEMCNTCLLKGHECGKVVSVRQCCRICSDVGHKRKECPNKNSSFRKRRKK